MKGRASVDRIALDEWGYETEIVVVPDEDERYGPHEVRRAEKQFGCGSLAQFRFCTTTERPGNVFCWPRLRRGRECRSARTKKKCAICSWS